MIRIQIDTSVIPFKFVTTIMQVCENYGHINQHAKEITNNIYNYLQTFLRSVHIVEMDFEGVEISSDLKEFSFIMSHPFAGNTQILMTFDAHATIHLATRFI